MSEVAPGLVTVFGGSGFVGGQVVQALARRGWRVRVACRRPDRAWKLQTSGHVGQIQAVRCDATNADDVAAALRGADAAINLIGILYESGRSTFHRMHVEAARIIASKRFSVDISLVIPHQRLTTGTASTAATATAHAGSLNTRFVSDLRAVTREAAVSLACGTILDALAPDEKPFFSGFGESDVRDVFQQAVLKLVARGWSRASVERTIDYYFYTDGILDDANQFLSSSNATLFPRTLYVATRPAASRALWVYMRTCYATPRLP